MPIRPTHLAQVAIPVHDLNRAKAFYGERLGLAHLFDAPPGLSFFQCGETRLMLGPPQQDEAGTGAIVYYQVDDIEAAHRDLAGSGVAFHSEPHFIARLGDKDLWLAICRDPDGHMVGLMSERA
jgi:methylmalonyl-CoA/ethylmalonyl-CoA epimerase